MIPFKKSNGLDIALLTNVAALSPGGSGPPPTGGVIELQSDDGAIELQSGDGRIALQSD